MLRGLSGTQLTYLTLIVDLLRDLVFQDLGRFGLFKKLVLAETKEALE